LHHGIADVVESTRAAARNVNALKTATYHIGRRIAEFEQGGEGRAAYGVVLIRLLGTDLSQRFGRGFGWRNVAQMRAFYFAWPTERIVQTLSAKSCASRIVPTPSAQSSGPTATATAAQYSRAGCSRAVFSATLVRVRTPAFRKGSRGSATQAERHWAVT